MGRWGGNSDGGLRRNITMLPAKQGGIEGRTSRGQTLGESGDVQDRLGLVIKLATSRQKANVCLWRRHRHRSGWRLRPSPEPPEPSSPRQLEPGPRTTARASGVRIRCSSIRVIAEQAQGGGSGVAVDRVLELVGTTTLKDSLSWPNSAACVCMKGHSKEKNGRSRLRAMEASRLRSASGPMPATRKLHAMTLAELSSN